MKPTRRPLRIYGLAARARQPKGATQSFVILAADSGQARRIAGRAAADTDGEKWAPAFWRDSLRTKCEALDSEPYSGEEKAPTVMIRNISKG